MPTTGGALAFDGFVPPYEATLTRNLREAGAIIVAKTGMTELANWVAGNMPGDYNALKGYGMNPYDPRRDPREATFDGRPAMATGGSSSGIGTAANFWAANVGTETSGSILSPSNQNMLAAVKPTVGRVSRYGVIPITADQDTPGPMAKFVVDAAIMLGALEGPAADPNDPATSACARPPDHDYTKFLAADGLKGARIGIPRAFFYDRITAPGTERPRGGLNPDQAKVMAEAIAVLKQQGATVIDPVEIPSVVSKDPKENFLLWSVCSGSDNAKGKDEGCSVELKYGMKRDFNKWLASLGPLAPVKTLAELRAWNKAHEKAGAIKYEQAQLDISDEMDVEADRQRYEADRAKDIRLAGTHGIDEAMKTNSLDALLFPRFERRRDRRAARLPHGHRAVRYGSQRPVRPALRDARAANQRLSTRVRPQATALRRQLHGHGVQRADVAEARLRLRAGDQKARGAAGAAIRAPRPRSQWLANRSRWQILIDVLLHDGVEAPIGRKAESGGARGIAGTRPSGHHPHDRRILFPMNSVGRGRSCHSCERLHHLSNGHGDARQIQAAIEPEGICRQIVGGDEAVHDCIRRHQPEARVAGHRAPCNLTVQRLADDPARKRRCRRIWPARAHCDRRQAQGSSVHEPAAGIVVQHQLADRLLNPVGRLRGQGDGLVHCLGERAPYTATELVNTMRGVWLRCQQTSRSCRNASTLIRRPRSKSASAMPLTMAAR